MNVIVLGSSGFVGKTVCRHLMAQNISVIGMDTVASADNKLYRFYESGISSQLFSEILKEQEIAYVINAAGKASVRDSFDEPYADFTHNTVLTHVVLDAIHRYSPATRFVLLSSAAVYGNPERLPVLETDSLNPISPYGFHKQQSELIAREFYTCFGISSVVLRVFSCYGAGQRKLFLWDLCNKAMAGKKIILKGCGNESRDFVHVDDVACCITHLIEKNLQGFEIFNLASGKEYSIRDTALLLAAKLGRGNEIVFEGTKNTGNPDNWVADTSKLQQTGFSIQTPFEKGIGAYAEWFKTVV